MDESDLLPTDQITVTLTRPQSWSSPRPTVRISSPQSSYTLRRIATAVNAETNGSPLPPLPDTRSKGLSTCPPYYKSDFNANIARPHTSAAHIPVPTFPQHFCPLVVPSFTRCERGSNTFAAVEGTHQVVWVVCSRRLRGGIRCRLCCRLHWGQSPRCRLRQFRHCVGEDVVIRSGVFTTSGTWAGRDGGSVEDRGHGRTRELICDASARVYCAQDTVPTCADRGHRCFHSPTCEMAAREGVGWWGGDTEGHAGDARADKRPQLSAALHVAWLGVIRRTMSINSRISHLIITNTYNSIHWVFVFVDPTR